MDLPEWNPEWEKSDPLWGRRGWVQHHYVAIVVTLALAVLILGMNVPVRIKITKYALEIQKKETFRDQETEQQRIGKGE
jgi:hypothetical protein